MPNSTSGPFRLYLTRHAHAAWGEPGMRDFDRPLDPSGLRQARALAEQALKAAFVPDLLVNSPARRCRETADALLDMFRTVRNIEDPTLYSAGPDAYFACIRKHADLGSLMIVGHNPMIEAVAHHLAQETGALSSLSIGFPTAGMAAFDLPRPLPAELQGCGRAVGLLTPPLT